MSKVSISNVPSASSISSVSIISTKVASFVSKKSINQPRDKKIQPREQKIQSINQPREQKIHSNQPAILDPI